MLFIDFIKHFGNISIRKAYIQAIQLIKRKEVAGQRHFLFSFWVRKKLITKLNRKRVYCRQLVNNDNRDFRSNDATTTRTSKKQLV